MSKAVKALLFGMALCVAGAILLDYGIKVTGFTILLLGVFALLLGPVAINDL